MQPLRPQFDWNDVRYLLAVAHHGGTLAASRALGVNQTTVQRRVAQLERCLGQPLVQRLATGYRLTPLAERLLPLAEQMERAALELGSAVHREHLDLAGPVRVTCPDPIVYRVTQSGLLESFCERYPDIEVEFITGDRFFDLHAGEADIALRAGDGDDTLVGREIGLSRWGIYASRTYVELHGAPVSVEDLAHHPLLMLDESKSQNKAHQWMRRMVPSAKVAGRTNNMLGLLYAAKSGVGVAALPVDLGSSETDLVLVLGPVPELAQTWRLLTTRELRATPRVAALFDFLVQEIELLRRVLLEPTAA